MNNHHAILHPIGMLKQYTQGNSDIEVEPGQTVNAIFSELNIPSQIVALVMVNKVAESKDYLVKNGDYIEIMAVIGGG